MKIFGKPRVFQNHFREIFQFLDNSNDMSLPILVDFNYPDKVFPCLPDLYNKGHRIFILDGSFEGAALRTEANHSSVFANKFDEFFSLCEGAVVLYLTQNLAAIGEFNIRYGRFNGSEAIYYNCIIYSLMNQTRFLRDKGAKNNFIERLKLNQSRQCSVLSLNNISKPHRLVVVSALLEFFENERDFVSFLARNLSQKVLDDAKLLCSEDTPAISDLYHNIMNNGPLYTRFETEGLNPRDNPAFPVDLFNNTVFSVVTESEFTNGRVQRITEKTLKTLVCCHDFILVGNPNTLSLLKSIGFNVDSGFIDNSYDDIMDPKDRMKAILMELRKLSELEKEQLNMLRLESLDRYINNLDVFVGEYSEYSIDMRDDVSKKIKSLIY